MTTRNRNTQLRLKLIDDLPGLAISENGVDDIGNQIFPNVDGARLGEASKRAAVQGSKSVGDALTGEMLRAEAREILIDCLARHEDDAALFAHHILIFLASAEH